MSQVQAVGDGRQERISALPGCLSSYTEAVAVAVAVDNSFRTREQERVLSQRVKLSIVCIENCYKLMQCIIGYRPHICKLKPV